MINWEQGRYHSGNDAWQYFEGNFEIIVPGTIAAPDSHWLGIAKETMKMIEQYHVTARQHLDAFIDRVKFANGNDWAPEFIEFGRATDLHTIRFTLHYRIAGDEYGLWSVAFHPTGLPKPDDLYPVRLARQQQ